MNIRHMLLNISPKMSFTYRKAYLPTLSVHHVSFYSYMQEEQLMEASYLVYMIYLHNNMSSSIFAMCFLLVSVYFSQID